MSKGRFYMQHDTRYAKYISLLEQWNCGNVWNHMDI